MTVLCYCVEPLRLAQQVRALCKAIAAAEVLREAMDD